MDRNRVLKDFIKLFLIKRRRKIINDKSNLSSIVKNDSKYYVIWRSGGGFFSIISTVLSHLQIADLYGKKPIVDFKNYPSTYKEFHPIFGSENVWEYYFEPIGNTKNISEYLTPEYHVTDGSHPRSSPMSISSHSEFVITWNKYIHLKQNVKDLIKHDESELEISKSTLGVHFRGMEMRTATGHPYPPSFKQVFFEIDTLLSNNVYNQIFLVTEGQRYLNRFRLRYGKKLIFTDSYRTRFRNSHSVYPRENHKYLLGLEILRDAILLSKCGGIISGSSNLSEAAILLSQGHYLHNIQIRNGSNSNNAFLALFKWYLRVGLLSPRDFRDQNL